MTAMLDYANFLFALAGVAGALLYAFYFLLRPIGVFRPLFETFEAYLAAAWSTGSLIPPAGARRRAKYRQFRSGVAPHWWSANE